MWQRSLLRSIRHGSFASGGRRYAHISGSPLLRGSPGLTLKLCTSVPIMLNPQRRSERAEAADPSQDGSKFFRETSSTEVMSDAFKGRSADGQIVKTRKYRVEEGPFVLGFNMTDELAEQVINSPDWREPLLLYLLDQLDEINARADEMRNQPRRLRPEEMSNIVIEIEMIDTNGEKRQMSVFFVNTKVPHTEVDRRMEIWDVFFTSGWGFENPSQELLRSRVTIERELGQHDTQASEFEIKALASEEKTRITFNDENDGEK